MEKIKMISLLLLYVIAIILAIYFILYGIKEVKNKEKSGYILIIMNTILLPIIIIGTIAYCSIIPKLLNMTFIKIVFFVLCVEMMLLTLYIIKHGIDEINKSKHGYILVILNIIALILTLILIPTIFK